MNAISQPAPTERVANGAFTVDATRGTLSSRVSSQWRDRPSDQRFLSLSELYAYTNAMAQASRAETVESSSIRVVAERDDDEQIALELPSGVRVMPTHWSFGQLAAHASAPAGYLRDLPAPIAAINLQFGLMTRPAELTKAYIRTDTAELRAINGPDYGRIHDSDVVRAVQRIAGNGTGDTRWKVPGMLEGLTRYNPFVDVTKHTTTLYASDHDVFLFLVDDTHPIEIGKLPNGDPDLVFRGFYVWNSEIGARSAGIATMYLRGVCQNRMLWGVEDFNEVTIRHSKSGPARFVQQAMPALRSFADAGTGRFLEGVREAKAAVAATNDDERREFLERQKLPKSTAARVIDAVIKEEGGPPVSVWDFVQGITAVARDSEHQDTRLSLEKVAGGLLDRVTGRRKGRR